MFRVYLPAICKLWYNKLPIESIYWLSEIYMNICYG